MSGHHAFDESTFADVAPYNFELNMSDKYEEKCANSKVVRSDIRPYCAVRSEAEWSVIDLSNSRCINVFPQRGHDVTVKLSVWIYLYVLIGNGTFNSRPVILIVRHWWDCLCYFASSWGSFLDGQKHIGNSK